MSHYLHDAEPWILSALCSFQLFKHNSRSLHREFLCLGFNWNCRTGSDIYIYFLSSLLESHPSRMFLFLCGLEERVSQMLSQCWSHTEVGGFLYVGVYLLLLCLLCWVAVAELRLQRSSSLAACVQMLVFRLCPNHWWGWRRWGTWSSWFFASWMNHTVSDLTFVPGRIWPWIRLPLSSRRVSSRHWGCQALCSSHCVTAPLALKWWKLRGARLLKGKILLVISWVISGSGKVKRLPLCYSWINQAVVFFCCSSSLWLSPKNHRTIMLLY